MPWGWTAAVEKVSEVERINHPQKVLLIRHASTAMTGTLCGQLNPPLNALGREQATALAPLLRKWNVRRLYASDLQRAIQTAQPLAELWGIPIMARSDLREISFGTWEGKRWSEVRALTPDIAALESSPDLCAPEGETFTCFRHRVLRALSGIVAECDGQLTAIVTHLGVMRVIFNEFSSTNQASAPLRTIDHCSVFAIRVDGSVLEPLEEPTVCS
jgi:broad specificity phosphatase PhoE